MVAAHSLKMGTIIIDQHSRNEIGAGIFYERYLNENIRTTLGLLNTELELSHVRTIVASGTDVMLAADQVGKDLNENCRIIKREDFLNFIEKVRKFKIEDNVYQFGISYSDAEGLIPGLMVLKLFLERTVAVNIAVPYVTIRDGYLVDLVSGVDSKLQDDFFSQIIASAVNLGRKYHFDEAHAVHVANHSMTIFDALVKEHGMNRRQRIMLEIAAILHDVGTYVKSSGHQKHGQYIVNNSDIFGLRQEEAFIIGNVINYHRGEPPSQSDIEYMMLQEEERILVLKMASILRVADALDRGHSQQVKKITVERRMETVVLHVDKIHDLSLEQMGLDEKGGMFQDVFGYKVILS